MKWQIVAGICLLLLAVATAEAQNYVYFVPQDGSNPECSGIVQVQLWMNTEESVAGAEIYIEYDPNIINVTNFEFNDISHGGPWYPRPPPGGFGSIWNSEFPGIEIILPVALYPPQGETLIGNLTIECTGCNALTGLNFTVGPFEGRPCALYNTAAQPIEPTEWINGTFTCGEVKEKKECLGDCYADDSCESELIAENVNCSYCVNVLQGYWKPYPTLECFCDEETLEELYPLCLGICPECSDAVDNDDDGFVDYPFDPECCGGIDNSELEYCCQPIPELLTFALVGAGAAAIVVWRRL